MEENRGSKTIVPPESIDMDQILASLKNKMESEKAAVLEGDGTKARAPSSSPGVGFDSTNSFQRDGVAAERFSPRDFRMKAATNDYETLQRYISISTQHMDRQDKHGWTALHYATRSGHIKIVQLLLENGCDVSIRTENGQTALEMALERFGENHVIVKTFNEFIHGTFDKNRDDNSNEGVKAPAKAEEAKALPNEGRNGRQNDASQPKDHQTADQRNRERKKETATEEAERMKDRQQEMERKQRRAAEESERKKYDERDRLAEKRKKLFQPISEEDDDEDIEAGRSRLDALLGGSPRVMDEL
jgi:hypothetical protein